MARISVIAPDFAPAKNGRLAMEAKGHRLVTYEELKDSVEVLLSDPPDCLVIQKGLPDDLDKTLIGALKNDLKLSFLPIVLVVSPKDLVSGLDFHRYQVDELVNIDAPPEEFLTRVELCLARARRIADNNPLTGLPGNTSILKTIQGYLDSGKERAVAYLDIDNFKPLNDKYGFSRGDEVIRMTARVLVNVVSEKAGREGFVGHVGGDDFVFATPIKVVREACEEIISNFDSLIQLFLDDEDIQRGFFEAKDRKGNRVKFPLTSISIAVVPLRKGRFKHYGEVSAVAAQLKKKVKAMEGSAYFVDRRRNGS